MKPMINSLNDVGKRQEIDELIYNITTSGKYTEGETVAEFEQQVSELYDGQMAVAFANCGSALFTVFRWMKANGHRLVVIPNNTFFATASMAAEAGLIPVLCDTNSLDPSMSVDSMIQCLELTGAKAVVVCHLAGWMATDYVEIAEYCIAHGILLFEDGAQAFGVRKSAELTAGSLSAGAVFSFYPTKAVPGGEGGALVTNNQSLLDFALRFRNWGKQKNKQGVIEYAAGFNLRMSEFDAAVLLVQVRHTPEILANRLVAATQLQEAGYTSIMGSRTIYSNYHKYPVLADHVSQTIRRVGQVYGTTDLMTNACKGNYDTWAPVSLHNSFEWATRHICLPIGEKLYEGMSSLEIREYLEQS
jgi:perosamine synthetase